MKKLGPPAADLKQFSFLRSASLRNNRNIRKRLHSVSSSRRIEKKPFFENITMDLLLFLIAICNVINKATSPPP